MTRQQLGTNERVVGGGAAESWSPRSRGERGEVAVERSRFLLEIRCTASIQVTPRQPETASHASLRFPRRPSPRTRLAPRVPAPRRPNPRASSSSSTASAARSETGLPPRRLPPAAPTDCVPAMPALSSRSLSLDAGAPCSRHPRPPSWSPWSPWSLWSPSPSTTSPPRSSRTQWTRSGVRPLRRCGVLTRIRCPALLQWRRGTPTPRPR